MPILEPIYQPLASRSSAQPTDRTRARRGAIWTGRALSVVAILFLLMDALMKLVKPAAVVQGTQQLGYPESSIVAIGITLLVCTLLYAAPRTAVLGAVLLTGYLGGAIATHVRVENPLFTHVLFPTYVAAFVWGGLYLREPRLRALLPLRKRID